MTGALVTTREEKGGRLDRGQGSRNGLAAQGCRGQQGPGEQVKNVKTASAGWAVEAVGNRRPFGQAIQY